MSWGAGPGSIAATTAARIYVGPPLLVVVDRLDGLVLDDVLARWMKKIDRLKYS